MRARIRNVLLPILAFGLLFWPILRGWTFVVVLIALTPLALWLSLRRPTHRRGPNAHVAIADRKEQFRLGEEALTEAKRRAPTGTRHGPGTADKGCRN